MKLYSIWNSKLSAEENKKFLESIGLRSTIKKEDNLFVVYVEDILGGI